MFKLTNNGYSNGGIQHKSLAQTIVDEIESQILHGDLKPGERLVEQTMCEQMQVSRSPLREAFRILEGRGFLSNNARKGVFVSTLSRKEAVDIYTIRANLESLAASLAVQNNDGTLASRLRTIHEEMVRCARVEDALKYASLNQRFHDELIIACGNERLIDMLQIFVKQTARYRSMVILSPGRIEESLIKHERLLQSIEKGDASEVERLRKASILQNLSLVEKIFAEESGEES